MITMVIDALLFALICVYGLRIIVGWLKGKPL